MQITFDPAKRDRTLLDRGMDFLSAQDVLDAFRATGKGWQTRMNDVLRDYVRTHPSMQ